MKIRFLYICCCIILFSCKKAKDIESPKISIKSPSNGGSIASNSNQIPLLFTATDNLALSKITIELADSSSTYYTESKTIYGTSYNYSNSFTVNTNTSSSIRTLFFRVTCWDENNNSDFEEVTFTILPVKLN